MDVSSVLRKNWKRMNRNEMTRLGLLHASPNPCKQMERVKGIEPSSQPWEGHILPLNHTRTGQITRKA